MSDGETFCREDLGEGSLGNAMLNDVLAVGVAGKVVVVIATILGAVELLREAVVAVAGR
jgi:multisubunit Na+/H+ antiporter MnhB subunit